MKNQNLERIISEKFKASFMSDTKWEKLIDHTSEVFNKVFVNYKLIYSEEIYSTSFYSSDFKPFFIEPTTYKEVEWIEFPAQYKDYVNRNNRKAGEKTYQQDIKLLAKEIAKLGQFETEISNTGIKVYGYR